MSLAIAFALGALVCGGLVFAVTRPASTEQAADSLRAQSALRDREQIEALTELARATRDRLAPVLDGLERALPADPRAGGAAPAAADVARWRKAAAAAVEDFADPPSGETATNVARSSLASAVRQISTAVDTYAASQALTGSARKTVMLLAGRQRADAIFTWSVGATALDAVNVGAGHGHQHVFLPASPGSEALTADPEPEGSQRP
ncbi:hypothetical protein AB0L05_14420 [Nonomuraea pusilla]|uniref:hypothetical protein n=1 Tax=Nonomuraea pusilla TaxID=46177 RepID=UPI003329B64D